MSIGFNKIIIIGYLGHNPEIRYTQSGLAVTTLNIAVSEKRKDGEVWKNCTDWFNVICLGKSAENVRKFLAKGRQVFVEGKLQNRIWEDKKGNKNVVTEIITKQIIFLGKQQIEYELQTDDSKNNNKTTKNKLIYNNDVPF